MRNYAYIRVSTEKQDLDNQKTRLLEYAQKNKILIDDFFEIEISSTKNKEDRKISLLLDSLQSGDTLLATELSRLGRKMIEVLNIIEELHNKGVRIIFVNQPELSSGDNKALDSLKYAIYGFFAQTEREFISQRTKQALNNLKSKGIKLGHNKTYLKSSFDEFYLSIEKLLISEGKGYSFIVQHLNLLHNKNFKMQSLRKWWNSRYEVSTSLIGLTWIRKEKWEEFINENY